MSATIPFTQYIRPFGEARPIEAPMPEGYDAKVEAILRQGWSFGAEVLTTGQVSLTIADDETDLAIELSPNGPEIDDHLKALIDRQFARIPV